MAVGLRIWVKGARSRRMDIEFYQQGAESDCELRVIYRGCSKSPIKIKEKE